MSEEKATPHRYIGIDLHKHYLVATGVSPEGEQVCGPWRVQLVNLEEWRKKHLTLRDAIAVEVTTNTFALYDELLPHVHSVTVVHPPDVPAITRARVKTDRKAALILAQHLAKGMLTSIWVPPRLSASCGRRWPNVPSSPGWQPSPRTACTRYCIATTCRCLPARPSLSITASGGWISRSALAKRRSSRLTWPPWPSPNSKSSV